MRRVEPPGPPDTPTNNRTTTESSRTPWRCNVRVGSARAEGRHVGGGSEKGHGGHGTDGRVIAGVVLALVASVFTASASITQRFAAAPAPGELAFSLRLIHYLIRKPVWFIGILCMIAGFVFQVAALRVGSLSLVQPVIATELLLVFGFLALRSPRRVQRRDWFAALAMAVGLASFLGIAHPEGGSNHAAHSLWLVAGLGTLGATVVFWTLARLPLRNGRPPSPSRRAALLAVAAGIAWGFVAAVIKELSSHLAGGPYAVFTNWSPYVLLLAGAGAFFLLSNAFQAGPLAASQPALTIVDPLVASMLGLLLFRDRIRHDPLELLGELVALVILVAGVVMLSRSTLVQGDAAERTEVPPSPEPRPTAEVDTVGPVDTDTVLAMSSGHRGTRARRHEPVTAGHRHLALENAETASPPR
jgi:multidrug transporter EmrE-like cation transporter